MLVLSRKIKQQIQIGNDIVVTILQVTDEKVRIGIEAPQSVRLLRAEIAQRSADPASQSSLASAAFVAAAERRDADPCDAERRVVSPPPDTRQSISRPPRAVPIQGFSRPARAGRELLGESSGLFPFLRDRAMRTSPRTDGPTCDGGAGRLVL